MSQTLTNTEELVELRNLEKWVRKFAEAQSMVEDLRNAVDSNAPSITKEDEARAIGIYNELVVDYNWVADKVNESLHKLGVLKGWHKE